jgi:hypothetical protein
MSLASYDLARASKSTVNQELVQEEIIVMTANLRAQIEAQYEE